ncbi:hypothetical protein [Pseudoalteromonas marina]|uniref:hypothetical protein n=1 Tax=Pseudoalteromonas marina TaxID=267375 RepID=UPI003C4EEAE5
MSKVKILKYVVKEGKNYAERVFDYDATFCEWGCDFEGFENNAGNYSTAIVKRSNGQVENVPAGLVKFVDNKD